ncbi:thiol-disulfide oxidoreductase DCC family protein [uncultured Carboxylicivirga sp.]|uniref:thiol-disulfide oxidoreductase DCC family protein n=1 Tax=Carboxylicivirga sp. M1479 TaxID=2594476 RepID=UPI001177B90C|nr:DUF393 domain-containing protein [Carboxylicivirga sp. M1479]
MEYSDKTSDLPIVYYDGQCNFCSGLIRIFRNLGGEQKTHLLPSQLVSSNKHSEVIVIKNNLYYDAGEAIIQILLSAGGLFAIPAYALQCLPGKMLNRLYYFIANNRYKWFGKNSCRID